MSLKETFQEIDRLVSEQKFEAASELAARARAKARELGDEEAWTRALVQEVQLRIGLHGYETAVRFLREEPWPEGGQWRLVLELFYARSLTTYLQAYSWEIGQRERVDTGGELDLKAWSREQIFEEAMAAYARVWSGREGWGQQSLGVLSEYFEANNYPANIRGTLRDAVTYLWQEALEDRSQWTPEEDEGVYRLSLAGILGGEATEDPADAASHPLLRIAAVLGDLAAWHEAGERPEAAFEARLVLLRVLGGSFSDAEDQKLLRRDLEARLDRLGSRFPWWSAGMAALAEGIRQQDGPDALVDALAVARKGQERHPGTIGGERCRSIAESILLPQYSLQSMISDGPQRRSLAVDHKNLERLFFRAYRVDLARRIEAARDYNLLPAYQEVDSLVDHRKPEATWSVDLPPTADHRDHRTYVTPPEGALATPGLYVVVASAREDFRPESNMRVAANLLITSMAVLTSQQQDGLEVTVLEGASGEALPGVEVVLYRYDWQKGHRPAARRSTGEDGRVHFGYEPGGRSRYFLLARRGEDLALSSRQLSLFERSGPSERQASLVYTDRSIYRPLQEVLWKVVAYRAAAEGGRFETLSGRSLEVSLVDPNGQVVETAKSETNGFGSASGRFQIPTGRLLGNWQVRSSLPGQAQVRVEEYKRPT
ncbi:MAG: hypothetical protein KDD47_22450, partial [Acidobacteria bacterium]|nr:hypothetical protein [Acidobacteriota bacterium]